MSLTPRALALVALGGTVLTGCGNGAGPTASPVTALPSASSTSATPSSSASASASAGLGFSPQSAEAFVRSYYDDLNTGTRTMDSTVGRNKITGTCNCLAAFTSIDETKAKGQHYEGGTINVTSLFYRGEDTVLVSYDAVATKIVNADGTVDYQGAGKNGMQLVTLTRAPDGWRISNVAKAV